MERKHYCVLLRILLLFLFLQLIFWRIDMLTPIFGAWLCLGGVLILLFWMMYELFRLVKKDTIIRLWWVAPAIIVMLSVCDILTVNFWWWSRNVWINGIISEVFLIYLAALAWSIYSMGRLLHDAKYGSCILTLVMIVLGLRLTIISCPWW